MKKKIQKSFKSDNQNITQHTTQTSNTFKKRSISNSFNNESKSANTDSFKSYDISENSFDKLNNSNGYMNKASSYSRVSENRFNDKGYSNNDNSFTGKSRNKNHHNHKTDFKTENTNGYTNDYINSYKSYDMPESRFDNAEHSNKAVSSNHKNKGYKTDFGNTFDKPYNAENLRDNTSFTTTNKHKNTNKRQYNVQNKNEYVDGSKPYNTLSDKFDKVEDKISFSNNHRYKSNKGNRTLGNTKDEYGESFQKPYFKKNAKYNKAENMAEIKPNSKNSKRQFKYHKEKESQSVNETYKEKLEDSQNSDFREDGYKNTFENKQKSSNKEKDISNSDKEFFKKPKSTEDLSSAKKVYRSENIKKKRYKLKSFNEAKEIKFKKNPDKAYRRKNYNESGFTRDKAKKDDEFTDKGSKKAEFKADDKTKKNKSSFQRKEKKKEKLQKKKEKLEKKLKKAKDKKGSKSAVYVTGAVNSYIETGKDGNAGVGATHKVTDTVDTVVRKRYFGKNKKAIKKQKKLSKVNKKIEKTEKKIFFKTNMEELKKTKEYQNTSKLKQFLKRREYKKRLAKSYKDKMNKSFSKKLKKIFSDGAKGFAAYIKSRNKKVIFILLAGLLGFFMLIQAGTTATTMLRAMLNTTASSTYLSDETVLSDCNNEFTMKEQGIRDEMDSVEKNHPGYDEYIIKGKEKIVHDTHQLLAYITAKYGVVKDISEIQSELNFLISKMYKIDYREEIEIRYKTVYYTYTDSDGNTQSGSYEEPYEYKKLYVTLTKKELEEIVKEEFKDYPNNLSHYEILVASKGNMELIFGSGSGNLSEIVDNPNFGNPGIEFDDASVKAIVSEAEKHLGKRYVFGANGPSNFDCSSFVCWTYTHSGTKNMPRTTAWGIYKSYCNPISPSDAKAGDIIFFKGTYNSGSPISHVGIYVGNGYMIHAGDPIKYARIDTPYWKQHFYSFGRPK